ncbi:MAG: class I tRNA ligase family protein [Candidatus Aminicenantes bacterium]|nr:class I tRNA ligase family protein [Candidatus Aminicenantes bacterium]MBL7084084.1 class I tRNA ligase family protein [Candidatus Aminicenantes bacterium]
MKELQVNVKCPYCKKNIMDEDKTIDGYPSVRVIIQVGNKRGVLHLSSIYGSYNISSEINIPMDELVLFFCPYCDYSLITKNMCDKCSAPMTSFELINGGKVQICSKRGCKKHLIEFSNLTQEISEFYNVYSTSSAPLHKK